MFNCRLYIKLFHQVALKFLQGLALVCLPTAAFADSIPLMPPYNIEMTQHPIAWVAVIVFILAYTLVMTEEVTHLRKSKPVVLGAGLIWGLVAYLGQQTGHSDVVTHAIEYNLMEYAELMLFLLVAMTYINAMEERRVFESLRAWLTEKGFSFKQLFWITGSLAFFISPFADNLTTALVMCAVVTAVGSSHPQFIALACINIVVAANAGGAFSPFGDITTLMVWQKGMVDFVGFTAIFLPALVNFIVPALCMHVALPNEKPAAVQQFHHLKPGALTIIVLFLLTILTAILGHHFLHMPPTIGMMTGLGYLQIFGYILKKRQMIVSGGGVVGDLVTFDVFKKIQRAEWDTLLFFYGIVLCVGGLSTLGYLATLGDWMYDAWGASLSLSSMHQHTPANVAVGFISAIIDNIPVMFAVLSMHPDMSQGQWLLVTLTAGVGGSLLSIGSAAGVALMGQSNGAYTFMRHLKWSWAILLGYIASIAVHCWWNADLF